MVSHCVTCALDVDLYHHLVPGGPPPKVLCSEECELSWLAVQALNGTIVHLPDDGDHSRWIYYKEISSEAGFSSVEFALDHGLADLGAYHAVATNLLAGTSVLVHTCNRTVDEATRYLANNLTGHVCKPDPDLGNVTIAQAQRTPNPADHTRECAIKHCAKYGEPLGVILVDDIERMTELPCPQNAYQAVGAAYYSYKRLAGALNCVVLTVSDLRVIDGSLTTSKRKLRYTDVCLSLSRDPSILRVTKSRVRVPGAPDSYPIRINDARGRIERI